MRALAPFVGNLTWEALKRVTTIDDQERELIMSMVGTVIYYPPEARSRPEPSSPTLTSITQLSTGKPTPAAARSTSLCSNATTTPTCDEVTDNIAYAHTPFTTKVEEMMRRISDKIANRSGIPTSRGNRVRQPDERAGVQDAVDRQRRSKGPASPKASSSSTATSSQPITRISFWSGISVSA